LAVKFLDSAPHFTNWFMQSNIKMPANFQDFCGDNYELTEREEESIGLQLQKNSDAPGAGLLYLLFKNRSSETLEDPERRRPTLQGINPINAIPFPRTNVPLSDTLTDKEKITTKDFIFDEIPGLLNHKLAWRHNGDICEDCLYRFKFIEFTRRKMNCCYCGRLLCSICCTKESMLPAQVIENGDFDTQTVCNKCEAHVVNNMGSPMVQFLKLSVFAIKAIGFQKIEKIKRFRAIIVKHLYLQILPECNSRNILISLIPPKFYSFLELSAQELQEFDLVTESTDPQKNKICSASKFT